MLSLMEAQSHFFRDGHQSLSELDQYRQKLSEEAGFLFAFPSNNQNRSVFANINHQFFKEQEMGFFGGGA